MKEFIEKLIGRLEKQADQYRRRGFEHEQKGYSAMADKYYGKQCSYLHSIEIVNELAEEYINTSTDSSTDLVDASTDTSSGWVACSERLPEEDGNYLVQQDDGRINILHYCKGWNCTYMDIDKTRWSNACERKNIIAWQPLPAPYKEGE